MVPDSAAASLFECEESYLNYAAKIRWKSGVNCPFCNQQSNSKIGNSRYHCNVCNLDHSLTVNTIMHKTKLDLRKWLQFIDIYLNTPNVVSYRKLALMLGVDKKTAYRMQKKMDLFIKNNKLEIIKILGYTELPKEEALTSILLLDTKRRRRFE